MYAWARKSQENAKTGWFDEARHLPDCGITTRAGQTTGPATSRSASTAPRTVCRLAAAPGHAGGAHGVLALVERHAGGLPLEAAPRHQTARDAFQVGHGFLFAVLCLLSWRMGPARQTGQETEVNCQTTLEVGDYSLVNDPTPHSQTVDAALFRSG